MTTVADPYTDFLLPAFGAHLVERTPEGIGAFARVLPWELGLPRFASLVALAAGIVGGLGLVRRRAMALETKVSP